MKSYPIVPGDKPPMAIGYKYISQKFGGFIVKEVNRSTELGVPYLSLYPDNYYNVSIHPFFFLARLAGI